MLLLTGGAGLIGSTVLWRLNQLGIQDIVVVDHLGESDKWQNLRQSRFLDYYERDDFQKRMLAGEFEGHFSEIIHLGACSSTTETNATYLVDNNFAYGKMLAEYAVRNGARMIYASSAATYGDGECGFNDDESGIFDLKPLNKYGYSKQLFDQWLSLRGWLGGNCDNGASFVGVKYSNVFGPNEYHKGGMRSMILRSFEQITEKGKVGLFKSYRDECHDGEQVRDFLYSKDAAEMTLFFLTDAGRKANGIFNVGYGATRSWNDLAKAAFAAMDRPVKIDYIEMPESLRPRYQYYTCLNIEKIRNAGFAGKLTSLEDAIRDYAGYFLRDKAHLQD